MQQKKMHQRKMQQRKMQQKEDVMYKSLTHVLRSVPTSAGGHFEVRKDLIEYL